MSHARGAHLGGIKTLEDLRERCFVNDETHCWHVRDANGRPMRQGYGQDVWLHGVGLVSVCCASWTLAKAAAPPPGRKVWRTCLSFDCVNPGHLRCWTRVEYGAWVKQKGHLRGQPHRSVANRVSARSKTKLTDEMVQWVRDSPQTNRCAADALECSQALVSHIRTGRKRTGSVPGSSVWSIAA